MAPGKSRIEHPREETRGRQQDLVGPLELTNLPLQLPQPGGIGGRHPRSATGVDVGLLAPTAQRIYIAPHPRPDPVHRRRHRQLRLFLARLGDQANRPLPQLIRVLPRCWHGPVLVGSEPPLNPGRFTGPYPDIDIIVTATLDQLGHARALAAARASGHPTLDGFGGPDGFDGPDWSS